MAETEMESDRHIWAFDSETHISTFRERPDPMAVASRCIRSKPHAPNKSGCHETKDPLQLGVYERHARRDYSICAACTEEHLHNPLTQVCEDPCFKFRKGHVLGSGVRNFVLVDH